ncbi:hypothetical protein AB0M47_05120 [Hamadaea sp. NPDC051192]|uniref:hypothetical protein n=1 Tax=Hamadaea sp. NPDC051192 TaxID=3154940 RepID=UPI003429717B
MPCPHRSPLWLTADLTTTTLPGRFPGRIWLGPASTFDEPWRVDVDTRTLRAIRRSLHSLGDREQQLASAGWTLTRRWQLIDPDSGRLRPGHRWQIVSTETGPEDLLRRDGWWRLPGWLGFEPDTFPPPLARLCRVMARLHGLRTGPSDQPVTADQMSAVLLDATGALAELAAAVLADADLADPADLAGTLAAAATELADATPGAPAASETTVLGRVWSALLLARISDRLIRTVIAA